MIESLGIVCMALAIIGVLLNNRKMGWCFYFWMVSNLISACLHYQSGIYSLVVRDVVFTVLAIEGVIRWSK